MNSYERVMNTLAGRSVDRVPVFAVLGAYGGNLTHTSLRTIYSDAAAYTASQQTVQETFGFDMILATFDYSAVAEAFGGEVVWFTAQAPNMKYPAVREAAAALALPLPDPQRTARLPVILTATRQLAKIYRERVPLIAVVPGPGALPSMVLGLEGWMETVLFDEPMARQVLQWSGQFFVAWANALLDAGANALVVTESIASAEMTTRELFMTHFLPHMRAMFAKVHGPMVFHHGGGRIGHVLDLLPGVPGLAGVVVSSKDGLGAARQALGSELTLIGNLDNLSLPRLSVAQTRERALACLQAAAPAGRYILSHSAADVPLSTPPENLRAMLQASEEYAARGEQAT
jgi:uroporphyrinogen decarboxylase